MKNKEAEIYCIAKMITTAYTPKNALRIAKIVLSTICDKENAPAIIYDDIDDILDKLRHHIED